MDMEVGMGFWERIIMLIIIGILVQVIRNADKGEDHPPAVTGPDVPSTPGDTAAFFRSLQAGWVCTSRFCREKGLFLVQSRAAADVSARDHSNQRFLGIFHHRALAYDLSPEQLAAGSQFADFLDGLRSRSGSPENS
jgi:hypothetical protein